MSLFPTTRITQGLHHARRFAELLVRAVLRHGVIDLGAQLAYWALLALFPFAIFLLTVVGYLPLGRVDEQIMAWLVPFMPDAALRLVWDTIHEVVGRQRGGLLAISLIGALWSAAGGASALQTALNRAYGVEETRPYWRRKGQALLTTIGAMVLLIVAIAGATVGPDLIRAILELLGAGGSYGGFAETWTWLRWPVTLVALVALLAAAYNLLPDVSHGYGVLSIGSVLGVGLWMGVSSLFRVFVQMFGAYARSYGALAAVVMLMTWIYLSGIVIIVGAEVNAALIRLRREVEEGDPTT